MTVERRTLLDFSDVKALEFRCHDCNVTMRKPVQEWDTPARCHSCGKQWFTDGGQEHTELRKAIETLKRFSRPRENAGYDLRLEIDLGD